MKLRLLLLILILSSNGMAQNHSLGLKIGPSIAWTERESYEYYKSLVGVEAGGVYQFKKGLFISRTGIGFQHKGFSQELIYVDSNNVVLGQGAVEKIRHTYLNLSEVLGIEIGKKIYGFAGTGIKLSAYLGTKVSSDQFTLNDGSLIEAYQYSLDYLEPLDLAITFELGGGIQLETVKVYASINYDHGIMKMRHKYGLSTDYSWFHRNLTFQLGVSRALSTKKDKS